MDKVIVKEQTKYLVEIDYNGIQRDYTSLAVAKREANRQAKRLGTDCCCNVTAEVIRVTRMYNKNEQVVKKEEELITSYTY